MSAAGVTSSLELEFFLSFSFLVLASLCLALLLRKLVCRLLLHIEPCQSCQLMSGQMSVPPSARHGSPPRA